METIYKKYRRASEILMEYYWYYDQRRFEEEDFKKQYDSITSHMDKLYAEYSKAYEEEENIRKNSKSARIAEKLEQMKLSEELITKIKLRNKDK